MNERAATVPVSQAGWDEMARAMLAEVGALDALITSSTPTPMTEQLSEALVLETARRLLTLVAGLEGGTSTLDRALRSPRHLAEGAQYGSNTSMQAQGREAGELARLRAENGALRAELEAAAGALNLGSTQPTPPPQQLARLKTQLAHANGARKAAEQLARRREAEVVGMSFALRDALLALQEPARMPASASAAARFGLVELLGKVPPRAALAVWPELEWGDDDALACGGGLGPVETARHGALLVRHRGRIHLMKEAALLHAHSLAAAEAGERAPAPLSAGSALPSGPQPRALPLSLAAAHVARLEARGGQDDLISRIAGVKNLLPLPPASSDALNANQPPQPQHHCVDLGSSARADAQATVGALRMRPRTHDISAAPRAADAAEETAPHALTTRRAVRGRPAGAAALVSPRAPLPNPPTAPPGERALGAAQRSSGAPSPRTGGVALRRLGSRSVREERLGSHWAINHSARAAETESLVRQAEQLRSEYLPEFATRDGQRRARDAGRGQLAYTTTARRPSSPAAQLPVPPAAQPPAAGMRPPPARAVPSGATRRDDDARPFGDGEAAARTERAGGASTSPHSALPYAHRLSRPQTTERSRRSSPDSGTEGGISAESAIF